MLRIERESADECVAKRRAVAGRFCTVYFSLISVLVSAAVLCAVDPAAVLCIECAACVQGCKRRDREILQQHKLLSIKRDKPTSAKAEQATVSQAVGCSASPSFWPWKVAQK